MRAAILFLFLLLGACDDGFDPGSRVVDFRLLAVAADHPYATPGQDVHFTTLWHEPFGRPVSWAWTSCVNPADTTATACLTSLVERAQRGQPPVIATGDLESFDWTVPADALDELPPATRPNALAGILTAACPGELRVAPFESVGPGELPFACRDLESGEDLSYERFAVSVRRVFVRTEDTNANPALAEVTWDGQAWPEGELRETIACDEETDDVDDCAGGERHTVAAVPAAGSEERGTDEFGDAFAESAVVQYYATAGRFELEGRTAESAAEGSAWVAGPSARGAQVEMWFVVRDNRGGVGWTSRRVQVR